MMFRDIRGPADSKQENFSRLCSRLLLNIYNGAKPVDGKGGDEGIDAFVGDFDGAVNVFQYKYFVDRVRAPQRRQIESSLRQVFERHRVRTWTLMLPIDLNPSELRWFAELQRRYPATPLDWWGATKLEDLLSKHSSIAAEFLPQPTVITVIIKNELDPLGSPRNVLRDALRVAAGISRESQETDALLDELVQDISQRSRLRLLIWGPGTAGPLYDKRCQVREMLRRIGHQADFSEEVWNPERLRRSGLNLKVAELIQAKAYDYILCFMASPGSIGEVHDFANQPSLAAKMMICVDSRHRDGYSAAGALRIFEGLNGKLHWFESPTDLDECHLSSRVVEQVEKVSEYKQFAIANTWGLS